MPVLDSLRSERAFVGAYFIIFRKVGLPADFLR